MNNFEASGQSEWPEPKVTNPDIANPTGVPYIDGLIHQLLDAQQDINFEANSRMSQSLCDASALIDEVERTLRNLAAHPTVKVSGDGDPDEYFRDDPMFNKGVLHAQDILNKLIGNPDYVASDGSEDYDTDLGDTILNQLAAAGLYDKEDGRFATFARSAEMSGEVARAEAMEIPTYCFGGVRITDDPCPECGATADSLCKRAPYGPLTRGERNG